MSAPGYHMRIELDECMLVGDIYRDRCGDLHAKNVACEIYIGGRLVRFRALLDQDVAFIREQLISAYELDELDQHVGIDKDYFETFREYK